MLIVGAIVFLNPNSGDFSNLFQTSQGLKSNDINGGTFSSTGSLFSLAWVNYLYECENYSEMYILVNGAWQKVTYDRDIFNTMVGADIQNSAGNKVTEFRADNFIRCNYPDSGVKSLTVSGNTQYSLWTGDTASTYLKSATVTIPTTVLPDNVSTKVSTWKFTATEIESKLIVNGQDHSYISVLSGHNGNYLMTFTDGSSQSATAKAIGSDLRFLAYIYTAPPTPVADPSREDASMYFTNLIQTKSGISFWSSDGFVVIGNPNAMDLAKGQQIKIKATMKDYRSTDGLPSVNILGPGINVNINLSLMAVSSTNEAVFENNFLIPRDMKGDWKLQLVHPYRSDIQQNVRNITFKTIDTGLTTTTTTTTSGTTTTTTTTTDGQIINTGTTTPGTTTPGTTTPGTTTPTTGTGIVTPTVTTKMHYIHRYDKVPDCQISTGECSLITKTVSGVGESKTMTLTSLTDSISFGGNTGVEAILGEIQITTVVGGDFNTIKDIKRATKSDTVYQATLSPAGATGFSFKPFTINSPQPNICYGLTDPTKCPPSAGMQLDVLTIGSGKLETELNGHGIKPVGQKIKITVQAIDGTFTLLDKDNKEHVGSAKGTTYEYTFMYGTTPVNDPTKQTSSNTCTSSDPNTICECPTGQTLSYSVTYQKLVCVDPTTGDVTDSTPKSDTTTKDPDPTPEPYCVTDSNGNVIGTYGNVSIDDPGCEKLFGTPKPTTPGTTTPGQIETDPGTPATGSGSTQPLYSCEDVFGQSVCANAQNKNNLFPTNGQGDDMTMTIVGILIGIVILIIIIAVATHRRIG